MENNFCNSTSTSTCAIVDSIDLEAGHHPADSESQSSSVDKVNNNNSGSRSGFVPKLWPQLFATLVATLGTFGLGTVTGWSSPGIPSLRQSGHLGALSDSEESWIASLASLGAFLAGFVIGPMMDKIGRKFTIFTLQIPFIIGWLLIIFASNLAMMYAGRTLSGFASGAMILIIPVYISEIVQDKVRGALSSLMILALVTGILFSYSVGTFVDWKWLSIVNAVVPIVSCSILFMPDSPRFLLEKQRDGEARKALAWLRGAPTVDLIEEEIKIIQKSIEENAQNSTTLKELFIPSILKPVGIVLVLLLLQQMGGIDAVIFNAADIFESSGSDLNPNVSSIILAAVQVLSVLLTTFLVDRLGRRPFLIISDIGMALCLFALGTFFYLKEQNGHVVPEGLGWLPLVSLVVYMVAFTIGFGALPFVMLGELVPNNVKGLAGGFANSFYWGLSFTVTRSFADLNTVLSPQGCYWLFASISTVGAIFCALVVPETKGKSLDEINALFK